MSTGDGTTGAHGDPVDPAQPSEPEEYPIRAHELIEALREQRRMQLKGGLYHLTQIEMAYNTNRIEGSQLTEDQTRYIFETKTVSGEALSIDDITETANHFRAFDAMIDSIDEPVTSQVLKNYHRMLKSGTSDAAKPWFVVGGWKTLPNEVGGMPTSAPKDVERDIAELLESAPNKMTFNDICDFHQRLESIHPFQDGNGRVGRLVLFQQCMQNGIMPFVVLDSQKEFYYRGLKRYDDEPGFLRDTFRSFQDAYSGRFTPFVPKKTPAVDQAVAPTADPAADPAADRRKRFPELFRSDQDQARAGSDADFAL
jgi:Fic family protein